MHNHREIERIAAEWLSRLDSGRWSDALEAEFAQWMDASIAHRVAVLRLKSAWDRMGRLAVLRAATKSPVDPHRSGLLRDRQGQFGRPVAAKAHSESRRHWKIHARPGDRRQLGSPEKSSFRSVSLVASVLLAASLGAVWSLWPAGSVYHTSIGGLSSVGLSDGSNVTLNTNSKVRVAINASERRVTLDHGEAFFEVAKDPKRRFIVVAGDKEVIATGTKFSVRRESGEIRVAVMEGSVRIEATDAAAGTSAVQVKAGSIASSSSTDTLVHEGPSEDVETYLSWRHGFLTFHDSSLGEIVKELNRYNRRQITVMDSELAATRVGGSFQANNVDAFVRLIVEGFSARAEFDGDRVILTR